MARSSGRLRAEHLRVLYITQHFATPGSSCGLRHWWATRELRSTGWEVLVTTGPGYLPAQLRPRAAFARHQLDGVKVLVFDIPYSQKMGFFRRCWSFLSFSVVATAFVLLAHRPDVVFASSVPLTVALPGIVARLLRHIPFVLEVTDRWPDGPIQLGFIRNRALASMLLRFERLAYRFARAVLPYSPGMAKGIAAKGVPRRKITVVPNCADTDLFGRGASGERFRAKHGLKGRFVCAHTGTIGFVNGVGAILDAAALLRDEHPEIAFLILGDGKERAELEVRTDREHLSNVLFVDPIANTDMPEALAAVDLGLMTIRYFKIKEENCANKFFDYLAAGLPVLLNYGGWQAEWLAEYGAGVSVPPNDARAIADAIASLASDRKRLREMGRNARRLAEEQFDRRRHMARLEAVLRKAALGEKGQDVAVEPWPFHKGR